MGGRRDLLKDDDVARFVKWMQLQGWNHATLAGEWEKLRMWKPGEQPVILFFNKKGQITVPRRAVPFVEDWRAGKGVRNFRIAVSNAGSHFRIDIDVLHRGSMEHVVTIEGTPVGTPTNAGNEIRIRARKLKRRRGGQRPLKNVWAGSYSREEF